jgi:zinc-finger-containing domain
VTDSPTCPYCGNLAECVPGSCVYPHRRDLDEKWFWRCVPCGAWVGTHLGTKTPLGRLANAELRRWKMRAHEVFDPIWRNHANNKRQKQRAKSAAYRALADALEIPPAEAHIGMFSIELCQRTIEIAPTLRDKMQEAMG